MSPLVQGSWSQVASGSSCVKDSKLLPGVTEVTVVV